MPPAMALRPDDALAAARGSMLIGASLPSVYGEAAALAERIRKIEQTHADLVARRAEGVRNAAELVAARSSLNQLLAIKQSDARVAEATYGDLKAKLAAIASHAADLQTLLSKVAALRGEPAQQSVVVVTAQSSAAVKPLTRGSLLKPVVGYVVVPTSPSDSLGPGVTLETAPGAEVIAPADGKVLFAGPYHKSNHVLILETALGYDAVLAGLDRVDVRPDDEVLAGEPVGDMPKDDRAERLYFELRQNGHGIDPAPYLSLELRKAKKI
jgi:septal ring factor EnvC (AmiA/AmiB activator)